jgi:hypothetical protein
MESEKITYWMTLGVLILATTTGFVNEHRGWGGQIAERSLALVSQASAMAANYAEIAGAVLGSDENDLDSPSPVLVDIQNDIENQVEGRLACAQRTLVRRQAEVVRIHAMRVRVRVPEPNLTF